MNKQPFWKDLGLWMLLAFNAYAVYSYSQNPKSINTIYLLFWIQSFFIGVFNVIGMLTFNNRVANSFTVNNQIGNKPGCAAAFFTVHYGGFHFVYLLMIFAKLIDVHSVQWMFVKLSFWAILVGCIMQYLQDKKRNRGEAVNIGTMFFMPYARILPMHIVILAPAFFHISAPLTFLLLKVFADIVMHLIYQHFLFKPVSPK